MLVLAVPELARARGGEALPTDPIGDLGAWVCIHEREGSWSANTGNGYYGGLQMDASFQRAYGADFLELYGGLAHTWTPRDQMVAAERARRVRGYAPWPNTARACGLL